MGGCTIVWFRRDLRLDDNPALSAAAARGAPVVPVYIWSPGSDGKWSPGAASRWWLHQSLVALDDSLRGVGSRLVVRSGPARAEIERLVAETGARAVAWNERHEPDAREEDRAVERALRERGALVLAHRASLLLDTDRLRNSTGAPYRVFTPFWKRMLAETEPDAPLSAPRRLRVPSRGLRSLPVEGLGLLPKVGWAGGLREAWTPGERGARRLLDRFLDEALPCYEGDRDVPARAGTSRLSPHLHFGEIGPRRVWIEARRRDAASGRAKAGSGSRSAISPLPFLRQLAWREFAHHVLAHHPSTPETPLAASFARFPWRRSRRDLDAWRRGLTGYPIVDAGMRELWATGWMHNRARMVVASFLTKDLRISWREGARWFWDTLVDADLANNTFGWQWTAGCGADAAPYFRVFNPTTQGRRFDPDGSYVRRWVPEIASLENRYVHEPWSAPAAELRRAGVRLGRTYPRPVVDHREAREEALAAFATLRTRPKRGKEDSVGR